ncbi:sensor histidine kinase [Blastococcus sp. Marseille-P5729]|uniref:sensor histidine kinase n=1 Tax=Blastococcus sp. Marseille-P5729 TaxID=2086582 RepID=UPI000D0F846A|nr:histidine kinase [Blastococcus sp. Marseille-P5729]
MTVDLSSSKPERNAQAIDLIVFVIASGVLLPASISSVRGSTLGAAWQWADLVAVVALHAVFLTSRRWPVETYGVACAAMATLALSPHLTLAEQVIPAIVLPSSLLFFYALYAVALRRDARTALISLGAALLGASAVTWRLSTTLDWTSDVGTGAGAAVILAGVAILGPIAAWALGRLRSTRVAFLAELEERARRTEADRQREREQAASDERTRIAAEMHDVVSHSLAVIVSQAEGGRMIATDEQTRDVLRTIGTTGRTALADMRSMLGVLRSDDVRRGAPLTGINGIPALVEQSGGRLVERGEQQQPAAAVALAAYRIVQESLTNALKHGSGPVTVELDWSDGLAITVTNPASGATDSGTGSGVIGMRQRAEAVGGTLAAGPHGGDWVVHAVLPLEVK